MGWHKPYNVSGTVHCGARLDTWCEIAERLLDAGPAGVIGHYTGAITVAVSSERGLMISSGFDVHDYYFLITGDRSLWLKFGGDLEQALANAEFQFQITVHETIVNEGRETINLSDARS